ncbi:MAG: MmgE/PrpD family protein, partial [Acidocella sp.]|nr:MmgE/PrpD family protein [Acidocella sp.]
RHLKSCSPERAGSQSTITLLRTIETRPDEKWSDLFRSVDPAEKAMGGRLEIRFTDGSSLIDEIEVAHAHLRGSRPFTRQDYIRKFQNLTADFIMPKESKRFIQAVQELPRLTFGEIDQLNILVRQDHLNVGERGIFAEPE